MYSIVRLERSPIIVPPLLLRSCPCCAPCGTGKALKDHPRRRRVLGRATAKLLATEPVSVQLRYLQTSPEIGVEEHHCDLPCSGGLFLRHTEAAGKARRRSLEATRTLIAHSLDRGPDARSC